MISSIGFTGFDHDQRFDNHPLFNSNYWDRHADRASNFNTFRGKTNMFEDDIPTLPKLQPPKAVASNGGSSNGISSNGISSNIDNKATQTDEIVKKISEEVRFLTILIKILLWVISVIFVAFMIKNDVAIALQPSKPSS